MSLCWEVDANGTIIDCHDYTQQQIDDATKNGRHIINSPWGPGFYSPKYDLVNNKWVEGLTQAQLLSNAQQAKLAELQKDFALSLFNGFTSTADGTSRTYAIDPTAMSKWTGALSVINSGKGPSSINVKDFNGNQVTLTSAQFQQMAADGFTYFNNQESHLWSLESQVNAATSVSAVQAITW